MRAILREAPVCRVLYQCLESMYKEFWRFSQEDSSLCSITGLERGLIVVQDREGERIKAAYSVVGSFSLNEGGAGKILFHRERINWSEYAVRAIIESGTPLEVLARINGKGKVNLNRRFDDGAVRQRISLEEYLHCHRGAFSFLKAS